MDEVLVVVGPGVVADAALIGEVAEREFAALGVAGSVVHARDAARVAALLRPCAVVLPGPEPAVRELIGRPLGPLVWVDVERADGVEAGEEATHLHGRGVAGLAWGIRHAAHRLRHPGRRRVPYGPHRDQWGELYLPAAPAAAPPPVVALVHGGYWRSIWAADLMEALCADLTARGLAVWNLEYRRPDLHGWPATCEDVAAGLAALAGCGEPVDLGRLAVAGHSAGAQLALRAAADGAPMALAVSLAGVLDLVEATERWVSAGAVAAALGGPHEARPGRSAAAHAAALGGVRAPRPERYAAASPLLRLPLGVPQLVVQGTADDLDLLDVGRRYARAALRAGDEVTYLEMPGDHFDVITPRTPIWRAAAEAVTAAL
ncbi:alpha/beta hydrolase fold domain-containing protein [Actinomadura sp. ATCC 31491]|uniref:Alpha/beta hydrolase fold domain-containing protein n=1 Tax=Actinomadura luzonensis TaxID=2805427 RepID=A0ABT0FWV2_9ACTN|nr:alpha/beta hydrolase fold domain-containing protein [Actinomadura luzonensis]MCK2216822.1 alpha/beta hydrolase fold domain-containing protein [Actinomadura luzonensis]